MDEKKPPQGQQPGAVVTPRAFFTSKKGQRFYAIDYGYTCWPIGKSGSGPKVKKK